MELELCKTLFLLFLFCFFRAPPPPNVGFVQKETVPANQSSSETQEAAIAWP